MTWLPHVAEPSAVVQTGLEKAERAFDKAYRGSRARGLQPLLAACMALLDTFAVRQLPLEKPDSTYARPWSRASAVRF